MKERIIITAASLIGAAAGTVVTQKLYLRRHNKACKELVKTLEEIENKIKVELEEVQK